MFTGSIFANFSLPHDALTVVVGTTLLDEGAGQSYQSEFIAWNENFDLFELVNDVAVIRVDRDIEFSDTVKPIKLPTHNFNRTRDDSVTLTGWGSTIVSFG